MADLNRCTDCEARAARRRTPGRWIATSIMAVVEDRVCESCGLSHRTSGGLYTRMLDVRGANRREWLAPLAEAQPESLLPRERRTIEVKIPVCHNCFIGSPADQLELFPYLFKTSNTPCPVRSDRTTTETRPYVETAAAGDRRHSTQKRRKDTRTVKGRTYSLEDF